MFTLGKMFLLHLNLVLNHIQVASNCKTAFTAKSYKFLIEITVTTPMLNFKRIDLRRSLMFERGNLTNI